MARPRARHLWRLVDARIPVGHLQRDRRPGRMAPANPGQHLDGVRLNALPGAAAIAALPPLQLSINGRLIDWSRKCFPMAGETTHRWSGQVLEPVDALAYIGRNPRDEENVYIVTGDSGHGMTHATIASMLIPDLIGGRENPWQAIYDPSRKSAKSLVEYAHENANVAVQYRDWVTAGGASSLAQIAPGQGAVLRDGMRKLAAFRDEQGNLHTFSAVCPHLQCIVRWNGLEQTFDCPCHGSRFATDGHAVNGPAISGLTPA